MDTRAMPTMWDTIAELADSYAAAIVGVASPSGRPLPALIADPKIHELVVAYIDWRESCIDVRDTYREWCESALAKRAWAAAVFETALAEEEEAAFEYEALVNEMRDCIARARRVGLAGAAS